MSYSTIEQKMCNWCKKELEISCFRLTIKRGKPYYRTDCIKCEQRKEGERRMAKNPIIELQGEKWVTLYENRYALSNFGRVKIFNKRITSLSNPYTNNVGYKIVSCTINGQVILKSLHRLLTIHFIPNPNNYPTVNHINGIKTDNRLENLEWCTYAYNNEHARNTGLNKGVSGEQVSNSKLTNAQVLEIFNSSKKGTELAKEYNVSIWCISCIKTGETWSQITGKEYIKRKRIGIQ